MTIATGAILAAMLQLSPLPDGHDASERDRYLLIAETISATVEDDIDAERTNWSGDELAAMIVATSYHESKFQKRIHAGQSKGDGGKSTCLMQIYRSSQRVGRRHRWNTLAGLDSAATARCIETGADHIEHHAQRCGRSWGCVMAIYQGHKSSRNPVTQKRLATFWRVLGMLRGDGDSQRSTSSVNGGLHMLGPWPDFAALNLAPMVLADANAVGKLQLCETGAAAKGSQCLAEFYGNRAAQDVASLAKARALSSKLLLPNSADTHADPS